ncbi:AAA family ATPase [Megamonas funiformis]|jgi:AAA15 family ATPase/GTPase|uniref:AAA family ATPase n=1 Tax=Megamonas funiformis TaxID=437897 RepID=UPI00267091AD|nr:ATP-binding protein [Megamonas funiformis]
MFEYVKLKNYKSFGDVEFNLLDKNGNPKKLLLIYGKNGIGKSNLASSFFMLSETLRTMDVRDIMQSILSDLNDLKDEDISHFLKMRYKDIETLIQENKMVDSDEPMYLEFGFKLHGKNGRYILETDNTQIIHERLEYTLIKNRGVYFDITPNKATINSKIFLENSAYQEIQKSCNKYWGKHSLLAILLHESDDKADMYIKEQINDNFNIVLKFLSRISCKVKFGSHQERGVIGLPPEIFGNYDEGTISLDKKELLNRTENMLNAFFKSTYTDIKKIYYKQTRKKNRINYKLMISKYIAGMERDIAFSSESTGTQSLLQLLPFMLVVVKGSVAIIDEFDTALHDILVESLVTALNKASEGQLILTTHNTLLMESNIPKENIYVINEIEDGNKEIQCITHYDNKIHKNTNIRNQYLNGTYHGIPTKTSIDFNFLLKTLENDQH